MPFEKGNKLGKGRPRGSMNKRSMAMREEVEKVCPGYDPIVALAMVAADDTKDDAIRIQCHKELAPYFYPKLKVVEAEVDAELSASNSSVQWIVTSVPPDKDRHTDDG